MGIIFDIDDTLIDHSGAEKRAALKFGQIFSEQIPQYSSESFHSLWQDTSMKHFQDFLDGRSTFEQQRINRIKNIFQSSGMTDQEAMRLFNRYLEIYEESWALFSDVIPFLESCRLAEIPLGIISDGSREQQEKKLKVTGIRDYFNFVITAESEKMKKPDPLFFRKGKELIQSGKGMVYYIGDDLKKDALGAANAGLTGIWLNRKGVDEPYDPAIGRLDELSLEDLSCS